MKLTSITEEINRAFDVGRLPFRRNLTPEEIKKLQAACSLAFTSEIHPQIIEKIMHYCYYVERHMQGRAAGNIEDLIIRYLLRYFASIEAKEVLENQSHLEIGVLFGAATIFSCHAVQLAGKDIPTVVIDPFEGYYGQDVDIVTKFKVDEQTFLHNLNIFGFKDKVMVFKGLSQDQAIIEKCKDLRVLSLIIDGDHSYEGVKRDWINYSGLVVPGGYVLLDDYNNNAWPGVTEFVNKEVLSNLAGRWEVVLVYGNSLILKRTDIKIDEETKYSDHLLNELNDKERMLEGLRNQIKQKDEQIQALHNSLSWKITAPLRRLAKKSSGSNVVRAYISWASYKRRRK